MSRALYGRTEISEIFVANPEEYDHLLDPIFLIKHKLDIWGQYIELFQVFDKNPTSTVLWIAKSWTILVDSL